MKRFFLHFLMLVMVTPGLASDWVLGISKAQAALLLPNKPCHCQLDQQRNLSKVRLLKDYSKTHIYKSTHNPDLQKPDFIGKISVAALAYIQSGYSFIVSGQLAIRGPPRNWPDLSQRQPAILQSTQRFRE